jgi:hypothetical protein
MTLDSVMDVHWQRSCRRGLLGTVNSLQVNMAASTISYINNDIIRHVARKFVSAQVSQQSSHATAAFSWHAVDTAGQKRICCGLFQHFPYLRILYLFEISSPWWWRQYAPLKRRSASTKLHSGIIQKAVILYLFTRRSIIIKQEVLERANPPTFLTIGRHVYTYCHIWKWQFTTIKRIRVISITSNKENLPVGSNLLRGTHRWKDKQTGT